MENLMNTHVQMWRRHITMSYLAIVSALFLFFLVSLNAQANTVTINDQSGVLNVARVRSEAAKLSDPILLFTTKTFTGGQDALYQHTRAQLPGQNAIAIGIDTVHRHLSIESGTSVKLSDSQASDAVSAFQNNFNGGDYTGATIAALDSLQSALSGSSMTPLGAGIAIFLVLGVVALLLFAIARWRRSPRRPPRSGGGWRRGTWGMPYYGGYYGETRNPGSNTGGSYDGGAGGSFGGGGFGGGGSTGGGAGGSF